MGRHCIQDPLFLGELPGLELGIDQVAVDAQLEAAALGRDELERLDLLFVRGQQLARQTDGLRLVVSHRTVHEFNIHRILLPKVCGSRFQS